MPCDSYPASLVNQKEISIELWCLKTRQAQIMAIFTNLDLAQ